MIPQHHFCRLNRLNEFQHSNLSPTPMVISKTNYNLLCYPMTNKIMTYTLYFVPVKMSKKCNKKNLKKSRDI